MIYRKEIDGLRALAVIPVVLFHAGIDMLGGGYVGVDIFFVISGYLITSIILNDLKSNDFSIINFYERRARRIIPALVTVLAVTTIIAYVLIDADSLKHYSRSLFSVSTFSSNIYFYLSNGYFSSVSEEMPLLHTWSLAIEEQFYLFFPILMIWLWKVARQRIFIVISTLFFASLITAHFLSRYYPDANFYLLPSRAWELFAGSCIAFIPLSTIRLPKLLREALSIGGLFIIMLSVFLFDSETPFPSLYTLAPVLGTVLIVCFANEQTITGRLLSVKSLVFFGLISYSLYLWHQPIFAIIRLKSVSEPHSGIFILAALFAVFLAYLSWRFIEIPFRKRGAISRNVVFIFSAVTLGTFLVIGLIGHKYNGFEGRFKYHLDISTIEQNPKSEQCISRDSKYLAPAQSCRYFDGDAKWAVFGDSHVSELGYALASRVKHKKEGVVHLSYAGCPPAYLFQPQDAKCLKWINESLTLLESENNIKNVILGFRHSYYLFGVLSGSLPSSSSKEPTKTFLKQPEEIYWDSFYAMIERLLEAGKTLYILFPIPELPVSITKGITPFSIFNDEPLLDLTSSIVVDEHTQKNQYIIEKLNSLKFNKKLQAIRPLDLLCGGQYCSAVRGNKPLYFDDDHLNLTGAQILINGIKFNDH